MSRIGKKPIELNEEVKVTFEDQIVTVTGPKGELKRKIEEGFSVEQKDGHLLVLNNSRAKNASAKYGLYRALIANLVEGVSKGFEKILELNGIGYRVQQQGKDLNFTVGFSHPVKVGATEGVVFETEGQNKVIVRGIDKELVGQVAANLRAIRQPDAYKGKGIKYSDEVLRKKQGKSVKK